MTSSQSRTRQARPIDDRTCRPGKPSTGVSIAALSSACTRDAGAPPLRRISGFLLWGCALVASFGAVQADEIRDPGEVQTTVEEVLADPEYRHLFREETKSGTDSELPGWLKQFFKWLFGSGESSSGGAPQFDLGSLLFYIAIAVLAVLLVVLLIGVWKGIDRSRTDGLIADLAEEAITPSRPPGDVPANEYEQRALAAAAGGDFRSALRELVLGSMSWTERAGLIRYRQGLCNRDYIRAVWRRMPQRESLLRIVSAFERVFYGRRSADATTFNLCLDEFRKSFAQEEADAHLAS